MKKQAEKQTDEELRKQLFLSTPYPLYASHWDLYPSKR